MLNKNFKKAYSLIELSIVILIISVLITGALSVSVNSINNAKIKLTNDRIAQIYKALGLYMLINKKLPCPASLILAKGNTSYGTAFVTNENQNCGADNSNVFNDATSPATNLVRGMVPVTSLGLHIDMAEDGFGNKLGYIVDKRITAICTSAQAGFCVGFTAGATNPTGGITVTSRSPGPVDVSTNADFAIISQGANRSGAWAVGSTTFSVVSADTAEGYNDITTTSPFFTAQIFSSSTDSDTFDDIVFAKRRVDMVNDFNAMSLIPCEAKAANYLAGNYTLPQSLYGQIVSTTNPTCATILSPNPVTGAAYAKAKCGAFGVWDSVLAVACF